MKVVYWNLGFRIFKVDLVILQPHNIPTDISIGSTNIGTKLTGTTRSPHPTGKNIFLQILQYVQLMKNIPTYITPKPTGKNIIQQVFAIATNKIICNYSTNSW